MFQFTVYGITMDLEGRTTEIVAMTVNAVGDPSRIATALANAASQEQSGVVADVTRVVASRDSLDVGEWRPFRGYQSRS